MAIYSQGYIRARFITARLVPVWIERKYAEIKWHYAVPKKIGKRSKVTFEDVWHVVAEYDEASKDGSCQPGMAIYGGREMEIMNYRADDGINEIIKECYRLNPIDAERERQRYAA